VTGDAHLTSIVVDPKDGSIYVTGTTNFPYPDAEPYEDRNGALLFMKFDSSGSLVWLHQTPYSAELGITATVLHSVDSDGNVYANTAGYWATGANGAEFTDIILSKYGSDGTRLWSVKSEIFGAAGSKDAPTELRPSATADSTGNTYLAVTIDRSLSRAKDRPNEDSFWKLSKFDPDGKAVWLKEIHDGCVELPARSADQPAHTLSTMHAIVVPPDGKAVYGVGTCAAKVDRDGNEVWFKPLDDYYSDPLIAQINEGTNGLRFRVQVSSDGSDVYVTAPAGTLEDKMRSRVGNYVKKLDYDGNTVWFVEHVGLSSQGLVGMTLDEEADQLLGVMSTTETHGVGRISTTDGSFTDFL
jgi:hypothetical protein